MATIQKRTTDGGKNHFRVIVRLRGHPTRTATFRRRTDAKRWAQQVEAAIREGRYFKTVEANRRTLGELIDRYLAEQVSMRPKGRRKLECMLGRWRHELGDSSSPTSLPLASRRCGTGCGTRSRNADARDRRLR